jgi:elongation factor Ts
MAVSMDQIKELRERTGAGILEAKKVLESTNGDMKQALELMRERGLQVASKKASREAREGRIDTYIHHGSKLGAMVEVNCETDFVARNEAFIQLTKDLAMQLASSPETKYLTRDEVPEGEAEAYEDGTPDEYIKQVVLLEQPFVRNPSESIQDKIQNTIAKTGENIVVRRFARFEVGA